MAHAHLVTTGLGPVYDGMSHFVHSPEEVFPVSALALFAGLRGPKPARFILFVLPAAWIAGGLGPALGLAPTEFSGEIVTAAIFVLVGGMLVTEAFHVGGMSAARMRVPHSIAIATALLLGLIRGDVDVTGFTSSDRMATGPGMLLLLGVAATAFVLTALAASWSLSLKAMWSRITVCVIGSWAAALGLLLAGWSIHLAKISSQ
jgi:hypothetical protein